MANKKMVARVDHVYEQPNGEMGFAVGFQEFEVSAKEAARLQGERKADFANEKDAEEARKASVREGDERVRKAHIKDLNANRAASDVGLKGTDAAGSNAMPATGADFENEGEATGAPVVQRVRTARGGDRSVANTNERGPFTEAEAAASVAAGATSQGEGEGSKE